MSKVFLIAVAVLFVLVLGANIVKNVLERKRDKESDDEEEDKK